MTSMSAADWDARYRSAELVWSATPNMWVEQETAGLMPGRALDLACGEGRNSIWLAEQGWQVTGVDFSPVAVRTARVLAARAGLAERASFVCATVQDAAEALGHRTFGIVYVSLGALCWLPSVEQWAGQVAALTRPGGRLYLHDSHPLSWSLADEAPVITHTYFEEPEPFVDDSGQTYSDADRPLANTRTYEWNHSIGEVVTAVVGHGLRIDVLTEHDWTVHQRFPWLVESTPRALDDAGGPTPHAAHLHPGRHPAALNLGACRP